ncbi:hypothetical protein C8F04DRAFT_1183649 [Mycena alexandri]|uniref:Uncharacterized protein n=1 Tax=Mycena alexandri TaxID=1745969 RepID=A0AAD6STR0_9AGAR|nr:hypothetical protein C8F04DRAFT_1183649 [Mycena alexandri]
MDQIKVAIAMTLNAPSPASIALAASEAQCTSLEATIQCLRTQLVSARSECKAARRDKEIASTRYATLQAELQQKRAALDVDRRNLELAQGQHAADRDSLRHRRSRLDADEPKLLLDKHSALGNLKRSVAVMEADVGRDNAPRIGVTGALRHEMPRFPVSSSQPPAVPPPRLKRQRLDPESERSLKTSTAEAIPPQDASPPADDIPKRRVIVAPCRGSGQIEYRPWLGYSEYVKSSDLTY